MAATPPKVVSNAFVSLYCAFCRATTSSVSVCSYLRKGRGVAQRERGRERAKARSSESQGHQQGRPYPSPERTFLLPTTPPPLSAPPPTFRFPRAPSVRPPLRQSPPPLSRNLTPGVRAYA